MNKPTRENKLPTLFIPIPLQEDYFKINVVSPSANSKWWLAGRLILFIGNSSDPNRIRKDSYTIPLKFWQFARFEILPDNTYHLQFEPVYWLPDIQIEVKQYFEV